MDNLASDYIDVRKIPIHVDIYYKLLLLFLPRRQENTDPSSVVVEINDQDDVNNLIPNSFLLLFTAHEFLGRRQWCTNDNGELLLYTLDTVAQNIKAPIYDACRDVIYEYVEQVRKETKNFIF